MTDYPVAEKFVSINGEGTKAGETAVFIRFSGCNLDCSYCDTKWANEKNCPVEYLTSDELAEYANNSHVKNVTITGGEPLLQRSLHELTEKLILSGHNVEIESNGSLSISELSKQENRPTFTLDYKLPSSGMEKMMNTDNFNYLNNNDTVKFVSGSLADLERALDIINEYSLTSKCHVYFSPVFGQIDPAEIVDFMIKHKLNNARIQLQLHKYIWDPEKRGV